MIFFVAVSDEFFTAKPTGIWLFSSMCLHVMGQTGAMPEYLEARFIWTLIFPDIRCH